MIDFGIGVPLEEAVGQLSRRTPLGAMLSSAEWETLSAELRQRAFFSAMVENEQLLASMQGRLVQALEMKKTLRPGGREAVSMDRGRFIEEMREELRKAGYKRGDAKRGSLRDLKSNRRLGLIWDMNMAQAHGYARWKAEMDPAILAAVPAMEFVRDEQRLEKRNWPRRWRELGGRFFPGKSDYPEGRMIALKSDPIWTRLNRFGVPWKPFDWGSGMGTRNVRRREAEKLGLVKAADGDAAPPIIPFNTNVRMSVRGLPESGRESLRSKLGDTIRFDGDAVILQPITTPEDYERRNQNITEQLRERARRLYHQASEEFRAAAGRRAASGDGRADVDLESQAGAMAQIYLAQASAVAVGRKALFHDTMPQGLADRLIRGMNSFPANVRAPEHRKPVSRTRGKGEQR